MTHDHTRKILCAVGLTMMLAACSGQPASPTSPSALDRGTAAAASGTTAAATNTEGITIASAPAPSPSTANFEIKFMTDIIDHHRMAVMMAEMCLAKAGGAQRAPLAVREHQDGTDGGD